MSDNRGQIKKKEFGIGQRLSGPRKNGGASPNKHKRKVWYEGLPNKIVSGKEFSSTYNSR